MKQVSVFIMRGGKGMKLLKIKDNLGYFLNSEDEFVSVDKITKDDLLRLVNLILEDEVEIDEYNDGNLKSQAHQIVYKNISEKLNGLKERKQEFIDESERAYLQEYERYSNQNPE